MSALAWILIAAGVLVVVLGAFFLVQRQRSTKLRQGFGPEYDRTIAQEGRRSGEAQLRERVERRQQIEIRDLPADARARYVESWRLIQERFVDQPAEATGEADRLVQQVMRERGYPTEDFEQRAADISVDHPELVADYRAAHRTAEANDRGDATTEELRKAMVSYRSLFQTLLGSDAAPAGEEVRTAPEGRDST